MSGVCESRRGDGVLNHAYRHRIALVIGIMDGCIILLAWVVRNLPNLRVKKKKKSHKIER